MRGFIRHYIMRYRKRNQVALFFASDLFKLYLPTFRKITNCALEG